MKVGIFCMQADAAAHPAVVASHVDVLFDRERHTRERPVRCASSNGLVDRSSGGAGLVGQRHGCSKGLSQFPTSRIVSPPA